MKTIKLLQQENGKLTQPEKVIQSRFSLVIDGLADGAVAREVIPHPAALLGDAVVASPLDNFPSGVLLQTVSGRRGTAVGGAATTIDLDTGAVAADGAYDGLTIRIVGGTGAGQSRTIASYTSSNRRATVAAWTTNPDNTSVFEIEGHLDVSVLNLSGGSITATRDVLFTAIRA